MNNIHEIDLFWLSTDSLPKISETYYKELYIAVHYNYINNLLFEGINVKQKNDQIKFIAVFDNENDFGFTFDENRIKTILEETSDEQFELNFGEFFPIHIAAIFSENTKALELLLENGANLRTQNSIGYTALIFAVMYNENPSIIEFIINQEPDIKNHKIQGVTPLGLSIKFNRNPLVIQKLMELGCKGDNLYTFAIDSKREPSIFKLIAENGTNINDVDEFGTTPIEHAISKDSISDFDAEVIKTFISLGAEPKVDYINLILDLKRFDILDYWIYHGLDINITNLNGDTILHICARYGHISTFIIMVNYGVDFNTANKEGKTPVDMIEENGMFETIKMIYKFKPFI